MRPRDICCSLALLQKHYEQEINCRLVLAWLCLTEVELLFLPLSTQRVRCLREITGFGFLARGVVKQSIRLVFSAFRFAMDGYWRPSRLPPPWTARPGQGLAVNQGPESLTSL